MNPTVIAALSRARSQHGRKLARFGAVSAFNVLFGQLILFTAQVVFHAPPVGANIISVCVGAVPAYFLSRYWVWEKRGKSHIMREVVPFWALALLGFTLSTFAVWYVDTHFHPTPVMVNLTNLTAFGLVWLAKFFVLDRILFKPREAPAV